MAEVIQGRKGGYLVRSTNSFERQAMKELDKHNFPDSKDPRIYMISCKSKADAETYKRRIENRAGQLKQAKRARSDRKSKPHALG